MTPGERGFLLLTSQLGNPERKVLTVAQLRTLATRVRALPRSVADRELEPEDLRAMGFSGELAGRIMALLDEEELLDHYLSRGARAGCVPLTRVTAGYPIVVRKRLGLDSPGCLWARGDLALLDTPMVALAGSRELREENRAFAREVGRQAARQGYTLVSGNARGADRTAQESCLEAGGRVICVVADALNSHAPDPRILYLSEDGFDLPFTALRALSRNRVIHSLGERTLIAQCGLRQGGTWDGTVKNLRAGWSPVFCFEDGSEAARLLEQMGAQTIARVDLCNLNRILPSIPSLFDQ